MIYIALATAWLATGGAVCVGIYITKSAWCLWALLIPAFIKIEETNKS